MRVAFTMFFLWPLARKVRGQVKNKSILGTVGVVGLVVAICSGVLGLLSFARSVGAKNAAEEAKSTVLVLDHRGQKMTAKIGEEREAYVVHQGEVIGHFRHVPVDFLDDESDKLEFLVVPSQMEFKLNEPVFVRYVVTSNGRPSGMNHVLELSQSQ